MKEGNSLPLRAQSWFLVDQSNAGLATTIEHVVEVVNGKANVMNAGPSPGNELSNGRVISGCLEEFNERFTARDTGDAGTISIVEQHLGHLQNIAQKGKQIVERSHSNADMGNAGSTALIFRHVD